MNPLKAFFRTLGYLVGGRLNFPRDRVGEIISCSLFLFALLMAQIVHAEPANPVFDSAALDAFVAGQMDRHRIPGLAVAVTHGEDIVYLRALGTAGSGRALSPQTPFYIGSMSKSFTALAVMQLVEAGKLDLDAPVQTYLPWFAVADGAASKTITVRHLLNQTSGFARRDHTNEALPQDATLQDAVRNLSSAKPSQPPGSKYQYFNANYTILGLLIETVSGHTYGEYLRKHIFVPLEMEHSYTSPEEAKTAGLAQGYGQLSGFPVPREQPHLEYDLPAGFIMSTAEDMAHYLIAQLNGGRYGQVQVLSPAGIAAMQRPVTELNSPYGMGWEAKTIDGIPTIAHSGGLETFYARAILLPQHDYGLVVLINQNGLLNLLTFERMTEDMVRLLAGAETRGGLSLKLIYLAITAVILLDLGRHALALLRLPRWREKVGGKPIGRMLPGIAAQIVLPLVILFGLPALLLASLGRMASQVLIAYYLPEMALWIVTGATLTLLRGLIKIWMLRKDAGEREIRLC